MGCGASAEKYKAPTTATTASSPGDNGGVNQICTDEGIKSVMGGCASTEKDQASTVAATTLSPASTFESDGGDKKQASVTVSGQARPRRELSFQDWGTGDLKEVSPSDSSVTAPLVIVEPWEHVGYNALSQPVRASTNVAVLAERICLESQCVPLWREGTAFQTHQLAAVFEGKTLVFEGGHPSVYDPSSFTQESCPREFIYSVYKQVMLMAHKVGSVTFICLSHQIAIAVLVELVKDAVDALQTSGDTNLAVVGDEIHAVGRRIKIYKHGAVLIEGYDHVNDKGWDQFATAPNELKEAASLLLHPFDASMYLERDDLKICAVAQQMLIESAMKDEIKQQMAEDSDGFFLAMFHSDEVNVEAVLFVNWALGRIACAAQQVPSTLEWLKSMPVAVEVTACTKDDDTHEMVTEVAAFRIDYVVDGERKSYYSCQFHPELSRALQDSRHFLPPSGDDGERLLHSLLLGKHIAPPEPGESTAASSASTCSGSGGGTVQAPGYDQSMPQS